MFVGALRKERGGGVLGRERGVVVLVESLGWKRGVVALVGSLGWEKGGVAFGVIACVWFLWVE